MGKGQRSKLRGRKVTKVPLEDQCDCCPNRKAKVMNSTTSNWCALWFYGEYCDECFDEVEQIMKKEQERNCIRPKETN
jgi:bacterioferritin-associated ferredoxin